MGLARSPDQSYKPGPSPAAVFFMLRLMSEFLKDQTNRMPHLDGEEGGSLLFQHEGIATVLLWPCSMYG